MRKMIIILAMVLALTSSMSMVKKTYGEGEIETSESDATIETDQSVFEKLLKVVWSITKEEEVDGLTEKKVSANAKEAVLQRISTLQSMEEAMECHFDRIVSTPVVTKMRYLNTGSATVEVDLTTEILYHYHHIDDSNDYMAFGELHEVEFEKKEGDWRIVSDEAYGFGQADNSGSRGAQSENTFINPVGPSAITLSGYSVSNAIGHATQFCGFPLSRRYQCVTGLSGYNPTIIHSSSNYSDDYPNYPADCANFVSQCLKEGGMVTDDVWKVGTDAFIGASELISYLHDTRGFSRTAVNNTCSNVYPGNPVFWSTDADLTSSFHVGICTGYNTGGIAVACAHTTDVYRVPISALIVYVTNKFHDDHPSATVYTGTVLLNNYNTHYSHTPITGTYYYNDTQHYHVCAYCEFPCDRSNHVSNGLGYCGICGGLLP